ncbi:MAG: hypothetical protein WBM04_20210 [Candidatus Korobacteraceae bacterium]
MAPNEEGKAASEQLFSSYIDVPNESSVRRRWLKLVIGICVAICVVACLVGAEFLLRPTPYDDIVGRLHPGMSESDVIEELGKSHFRVGYMSIDGNGVRYDLEYRTTGVNLPLIIEFNGTHTIKKWCFDSKCHEVK